MSAQQLTQLEEGAVYRFVNRGTGRALNAGETSEGALYVNATTVSTTDIKQQWYVTKDGDNYVLRSLYYAKYLKGAVTNKVPWSLTDYASETSNKFNLATSDASWNTLETVGWTDYGFMHDDSNGYNGGYRVVSWDNEGANNSHWTVTKVEYDADALQTILDEHPTLAEIVAKRTANFVSLFNEGACYTPKYSTLTEAQATTEYQALETELQTLATNIYNKALTTDGWAEANANTEKEGWSAEYAKKFRVQMYEPYSIAGDITGFLRMNAHSNNDNPTGIYVAEAGTVYVMVEGTIKDGATLRLVRAGSNFRITNPTGDGYALTTGLNIINITEVTEGGDHLYICYNVDTYNPNGETVEEKFPHKLSEYPPLKIHIEGGYINGFYSSCGDYLAGKTYEGVTYNEDLWGGVDDDNDWIYMETRANLAVLPIISHRQILLFQLNEENGQNGMSYFLPESVSVPETPFSYPQNGEISSWDDYDAYGMDCNTSTGRINIWMETWDRIMHAELATLGLISEDAVNIMNKFYPRWNSDGTKGEIYDMTNAGPDGNTYKVFCRGLDYSEYYNHHGVSLGTTSGYMSAGWHAANYNNSTFAELMGMPTSGGLWGPVHEIGHQFQDVFNIRGATEVTNNVFSNAATWYQGISTSRYNGGNLTTTLDNFNSGLPFVDYNIWSMTHTFYKLWLYYHLAGHNTQFYPRFFEMLRIDPLNAKGATATGTESMLKIYEKACDAAGEDLTEFFRAHGFFVLLDHYVKGDYGTTEFTQTQEEVDAAIARVKAKYTKENLAVILINDGAEATLRHDGKTSRTFFDGTTNPEYGGVNDFIDGSATTGGTYTATANNDGTITMTGEGGIGFLIFDENGNIISFSDNPTFALSDEAKEAIMTGNITVVSVGTDTNAEPVTATVDLSAMQKTILGELIAKAKAITEKVDDTYTKVGYYKAAAVSELVKVLEYAEGVYAGTSGYEEAYDLLYAEYKKVEANTDAKITLDLSKKYIINNKEYSARNIVVDGTTVFALENSTGTAAQWSFVESSTAGSYYLKNADGYYCPAVVTGGTGGDATTDQSAAGTYTLKELEHGLWAIIGTSAPLHAAGSAQNYNVVGWTYESTASQWYITITEADEAAASLSELQASIAKTETLLNEVLGTVTYTRGENIALQTTTSTDAYYIWSNAPCATEGEIANLVDGATNNYFHTEWNGVTVSSGEHYIAVDLGDGNTLSRFAFSHTTREADTNHAKSVDVYGSDDNVTYKYLGSASGMPQTSSTFWQFEGMMISSHRYLRFNVHANRGYWHMAEFDIMPVTDYTPTVNDTYNGTVTVDAVTAAMEALYNGKSVVVSTSPQKTDVDSKLSALETAYKALYTQYTATIDARKETLAQLAANTQALIDEVGTVEIIATVEAKLQTTDSSGDFYVTTNAQSSQEGPIANLVDGATDTFFHTDYSGADSSDGLDHYINIALGSNNATDKFEFSYVTRHNAETNYPTAMIVYGSTDGTTYEQIKEITTDMPTSQSATYNSDVIECTKKFTHLRFMVTANNSGAEKGGHPFFHMAEFDLTTIGSITININSSYNGLVEENLLLTSYHTTNSSTAMSTNDLVTSVPLLDAQIADQQAAYDKLKAATTKVNKTELEALIEATTLLKNDLYEMAVTSYNTEEVTLSATEGEAGWLYCNAVESHSIWTDDHTGVSALLDEDTSNWLHTMYSDYDSEDGLDHYLRVDLGDGKATDYIEFGYKGRSGHEGKSPKTLLIQATNDLTDGGVWTDIATLNPEQASASTETKTGCLGNGNTYRYWRFMVKENHFNNASGYGHPYFCITEFNVYKCTDVVIESQLKYTPDIYIYTTSELVTEVENAITAATTVKENADATQTDVDTEVEALKAVYDKLAEALKYAEVPVAITTDINSPKLYVIYSQRGDTSADGVWTLSSTKCWQYNFANNNITISAGYTTDNLYQLWYFTYDSESEKYGIVPVMTPGYSIGANDFSAGASKISAINPDEVDGYVTSWALSLSATTPTNGVYYNFKPDGNNTFLSNYAGGSNPLGFYGTEDEGSRVYFESVDVENFAFKRLSKLNEVIGTLGIVPAASEIVGEYTIESATGYSAAVEKATSMVEGGTSTDAEYNAQFVALYQSYENLAINLPVPGTLYKLRSRYVTDHYVFVNDDRVARYSNNHIGDDNIDADAIWVFEGTENGSLKLKNLQTGCYVPSLPSGEFSLVPESENAGAMTLHPYGVGDGAVQIQGGSSYYFHFNSGSGGDQKLIGWEAGAIGGGNPVYIEEVNMEEAVNKISHSITLAPNTTGDDTTTGYSTLNLGYPVTVPEGVTAYIITNSAIVENTIELYEYATSGSTIPANTPVILRGSTETSAGREFKFNNNSVVAVDDVTNYLGGTNYTTYESCLDENGNNVYNIYMLTRKSGIVAMRWMYENYQLVDGIYSKLTGDDANSDKGGYVKCSANKVYLKLADTSTANLSSTYYFGFPGGTTDIDKIEGEENPLEGTIYDLQGRKIEEVTVPGFYIVNGKKMFINSELLK